MSISIPPPRNPQGSAPFPMRPRRTIMACSNCRRRKIRCITTEQPPKNPCARCKKRGLPCEYVAAADHEDYNSTPTTQFQDIPVSGLPEVGTYPAAPSSSRGLGRAPPLPYTELPPLNRPPRHSSPPVSGSSQALVHPRSNASFPGWNRGPTEDWNPSLTGYSERSMNSPYSTPSFPALDDPYMHPGQYADNTYHSSSPLLTPPGYGPAQHYPSSRTPSPYPPLTQPSPQPPVTQYPVDYDQMQFFHDPSIPEYQGSASNDVNSRYG